MRQARRQSSVIGGRTNQFYPHFREVKPKKGLQPGHLSFLGHKSCLEGHVHYLTGHSKIQWWGSRFLPTKSEVKTKKKQQGFIYIGGHSPQNAVQWHWACYFLSGLNPCLGGAQAVIRGQEVSLEVPTMAPDLG